ncbi:MAG: ABC transporter substrate-binding protein [Microcoleaceae cyanobacterium]
MINRRNFFQTSGCFGCYLTLGSWRLNQSLALASTLTPEVLLPEKNFQFTLQLDWKFNVQFAGILLADYYNLYTQKGLVIEIKPWDFGMSVTDLVAENPLIIGCSEQDVILTAQNAGKPIKAIATMFQHSPLGLMSLPDCNVNSLYDLVGKKVGIHSDSQKVMDLVMGFSQLSPNDVEVVSISYREKFDKLLSREVDAIQCYVVDEPIGFADRTGISPNLLNLSDYGYDAYVQTFFVHHRLLENNPEQVKKFLQATFEGWKIALSDIPNAAKIIVENYVSPEGKYNNLAYQIQSLQLVSNYVAPDQDLHHIGQILPERWQTMAERLAQYHVTPMVLPLADAIDLTLWPA